MFITNGIGFQTYLSNKNIQEWHLGQSTSAEIVIIPTHRTIDIDWINTRFNVVSWEKMKEKLEMGQIGYIRPYISQRNITGVE